MDPLWKIRREKSAAYTRKILTDFQLSAFLNPDRCTLRRESGGEVEYGHITLNDALKRRHRIYLAHKKEIKEFSNLELLLHDGWEIVT